MLGYLTSRWQSTGKPEKTTPTWFDRHANPLLLSVAKKACTHPIHTIVTIAFLASYSYLGVLDKGLLESGIEEAASRVDFQTLLAGSKRLRVGEETSWQWEAEDNRIGANMGSVWNTAYMSKGDANTTQTAQELALVTLVFPESSTVNSAPSQQSVPRNVSAALLPSSSSTFATFSHDTSLAFSIPYAEAADFLEAMQEISAPEDASQFQGSDKEGTREEKKWLMRASKNGNAPTGVRNWIIESWTSFVDLLKVG
jgi:hydroxymethylglutaryl-CoA reductase (NADPH)